MTDPLLALGVVELVDALGAARQTVAAAESLTAGLFTAAVASVPGSSAVLRGGLVVYATDLKATLAGVDPERLATDGPVSESTAVALALGARTRCGADWGIGLTGVAGPSEQDGHSVGTVFLGIAGPDGTECVPLALGGERWEIRTTAVATAVSRLRDRVAERAAR
ncbi:CinA family protein [Rhodococcus qingshengii]|jgi:nicotinamide-nucleotide amidase|uniref:CinA family protein n=1 Tax=Rhodococcus qingshengii TaxID=334542 RepID=A0AAW6LMD7_RHOSG|nr:MULTISPECIES: CinA family protein [Rhodococcus]RGP42777.1 competence protein [Rhodococcus erythropolis]ANQ73565.1 competence protein [Rhodococcus sp. 008]MBP1050058.1 CinA family protein [Rhodococcus qingshengii]MBW4815911.1 CinA family protein [Rhodococcus qingshengii]MCD2133840.1 CinA family protein [Rhodococcus qingshengii]